MVVSTKTTAVSYSSLILCLYCTIKLNTSWMTLLLNLLTWLCDDSLFIITNTVTVSVSVAALVLLLCLCFYLRHILTAVIWQLKSAFRQFWNELMIMMSCSQNWYYVKYHPCSNSSTYLIYKQCSMQQRFVGIFLSLVLFRSAAKPWREVWVMSFSSVPQLKSGELILSEETANTFANCSFTLIDSQCWKQL